MVTAITATEVATNAAGTVEVSVTGRGNEHLAYEFLGPTFVQGRGNITLTRGAGTISHFYTAPAGAGRYLARVRLTNAQGNRVEVDFEVVVAAPTSRSREIALNASLGPVVTGLNGRRTAAGVRWTAEVSAQGSGATYAWSFAGTGRFTDATANPTVLTGYDAASSIGTLKVIVTDAAGLTTSARLWVAAGMFPDALVLPAAELVINEVDYDTAAREEFIEVYNAGPGSVDLAGYRFELVNGTNATAYASYDGVGRLASGGYFVIAKQRVYDNARAPGLLLTDNVQNGPDAIRIVETATGRVVDSVHYEGAVTGAGEGTPAGRDPGAVATSIAAVRTPSTATYNGVDFATMTTTPGAANTCS